MTEIKAIVVLALLKSMPKLALVLGDVKIEHPDLMKANMAFPGCHGPGRGGGN